MNAALHAMQSELDKLRGELKGLFDTCDRKDGQPVMSAEQVGEVRKRNEELEAKGLAFKSAYDLAAMEAKNSDALSHRLPMPSAGPAEGPQTFKSFGAAVVGHKEVAARGLKDAMYRGLSLDVDVKTVFQRTAGWDPEEVRNRDVVLSAQRPIQVTDLLPSRPTSQDAIKYMEETTLTNNAAEAAEGQTYGEAAFALTERTVVVEKIAVWLPMTDEQLEDVPGAEAYINNRLPFCIQQRLDYQILRGTGVTPLLLGVLAATGLQTQAKGGDVTPDAIYKAMTKVRHTGRATPGALIIHPNDWQEIKLLRTSDGIYIWGNPSESGPNSIWGVPVVESSSLAEGTAVVGDWRNFSELAIKRGITMKMTDSHSDYFINGKQAIRADMRCAVAWYRGAAFCQITGI
jgi:hypothetical protein